MATLLRNGRLKANVTTRYIYLKSSTIKNENQCRCFNQYLFKRNVKSSRLSAFNPSRSFQTSLPLDKIIPFYLSDIGEGIREVSVKEWFVKVGDKVEQFDNICEVQSDKASATITSRYDGKITKLYHKIDGVAFVGEPLVDIDVEDEESLQTDTKEKKNDNQNSNTVEEENDVSKRSKVLATPAVRRIAMQNKIDLSTVNSTGRGGRVLKEDVLKFLNISSEDSNDVNKMKKAEKRNTLYVAQTPHLKSIGQDKTLPITGYTKIMVKTMSTSLKIPHFVYSDEIDVTPLVIIRSETKKAAAEAGVNLTFMPFFIKAASLALNNFPILNSSVDENCENITYKAAHNIGVAMDTPGGLVVPNIKNVQQKSILEIGNDLNRLQRDGQEGALKPNDLTGGTFSLSNIGVIGGTYTKPVILSPQVSIGALGKIQILPRFDKDGNVVKAHIVCVSWSADHRVVDGVTMAKFSNKWKFYIENPSHLMLEL
ncbi:dihydrolipoamide branched chain transacylase E2 isoform X2 [Arctopsyche grandis]|uniref:dihydrolipoamide branched chain transacylase E2 isoform X2 n=1 Tax=Arctopsyche grandis TaxID=121162 RepID=UPI00406D858D